MDRSILFLLIVLASTSLWVALMSLLGGLQQLLPGVFTPTALEERVGKGGRNRREPFTVRLARSFGRLASQTKDDESLQESLLRAGLPYVSPLHYYSDMFSYVMLYGAAGLGIGLVLTTRSSAPPLVALVAGFLGGLYGATQPNDDVKKWLRRRTQDLTVDMTYGLPRLVLILEAYGEAQLAMREFVGKTADREISDKQKQKQEKYLPLLDSDDAILVGQALTGFGGNLFAEVLNRLGGQLSQGRPPAAAVQHVERFYPRHAALSNFLNIFVAGVEGKIPMAERLEVMVEELQQDTILIQQEAGKNADTIITIAATAQLLTVMLLVMVPLLLSAARLFGG
ncbi:MAG: hypothetical protein DWQ07_17400 [Chloroflexi bacterium]|nr:MAG: hypothetical protein DWQ07_17400 [Chloroflexota bacterium]MBL1195182.1 hypothetical protein [Chloroflexota bacterium]NOH12466.1 hypothetical protein [Chloroflexota bacterium]